MGLYSLGTFYWLSAHSFIVYFIFIPSESEVAEQSAVCGGLSLYVA